MFKKGDFTPEDTERELAEIRQTEAYKLAMAEKEYIYRRRQVLYQARSMMRHGEDLMRRGYSMDDFKPGWEVEEDAG